MRRTWLCLTILIAWGNVANAAVLTVRGSYGLSDPDALLEVVLATSQGEEIAGIQNDLLFDPDGLHLAALRSCTINPAISDDAPGCEDDPSSGPCKQLHRALDDLDDGQRFRGLILSLSNTTAIPDGLLYSCRVQVPSVLDDLRLPRCSLAQASDPAGGAVDLGCVVDFSRFMVSCGEVTGSVFFAGMEVRPPRPQVGDDVELVFSVNAQVYSRLGVAVTQSSQLLADLQPDSLVFRGKAVAAGRSTVQLAFTFGTEEGCISVTGDRYFRPGQSRTVFSPEYELIVAAAPSPTPTQTRMSHPPSRDDEDGGCRIDGSGSDSPSVGWPMLLAPLALAIRRRRRFCR